MADQQPLRDTLWTLIKDIRFCMLTTVHADGHLDSRPVTTQNDKLEDDDVLWFFMSRGSHPLGDIANQPTVNLAYAEPHNSKYVSISGTARAVENQAKKEELWSKMDQAWFPGGVHDPDLALLRVEITHAHFWDVKENKLVQLYEMAKATASGKRPSDLGRDAEVPMRRH